MYTFLWFGLFFRLNHSSVDGKLLFAFAPPPNICKIHHCPGIAKLHFIGLSLYRFLKKGDFAVRALKLTKNYQFLDVVLLHHWPHK